MMFQRTMTYKIIIAVMLLLTACSPEKSKLQTKGPGDEQIKDDPSPVTPQPPALNPQDPDLKFCSKLDLKDVKWPSELKVNEWTYYALALNITGSFEGREGWQNITGNFDGQGMSLGLMQQNLGQGSLQPLLIDMYREYNSTLIGNFTNADYKNMKSMLEDWINSPINASAMAANEAADAELFPKHVFNKYDIGYEGDLMAMGDSGQSVQWAVKNILDSKGNVTSRWKTSFQNMAVSSGYRSFQLAASLKIYTKAKLYFSFFKFTELRFFLYLFDIVVQNGSIGDNHLTIYNKWLYQNPNATEQERALALLEARLTTVKPQYVEDVRARKTAIIKGTGVVHKTPRDLAKEYCFNPRVIVQ